jgi:DNA-binding transcriptional ArsR family regulator
VFAALSDSTRREILLALSAGDRTVSELGAPLRSSQSALSQHLAVLRKANLVHTQRQGRHVLYSLRPEGLMEVMTWLHHFDRFWDERFERLGRFLGRRRKAGKPS